MKIVLVVQWLAHPGGSEMIALAYAVALTRLGHRVTLVVGEGEVHRLYADRLGGEGIGVVSLADASCAAERLEALARRVARDRPDLVHFVPVEALATAWLERRPVDLPVVLTETTNASRSVWWVGPRELAALARADGVAVMTEVARSNVRSASRREGPIRVIPPALLPSAGAWDPPARELSAGSLGQVGCVSRLSEEKGLEFLLSAISMLAAEDRHLRLHLFGDGQERARVEALTRAFEIEDRVRLHGVVPDIYDAIASCSLMVLPSLTEGLPVSLLEVMAAGRSFVASAVGGIPELVAAEDWAVLVPRGDSRMLARAIALAAADPDRLRANGRRARQAYEERWTARRRAVELVELYERVLGA